MILLLEMKRRLVILLLIIILLMFGYSNLHFWNRKKDIKDTESMPKVEHNLNGKMNGDNVVHQHHPHLRSEEDKTTILTTNMTDKFKPYFDERREQEAKSIKTDNTNDPDKLYKARRDKLLDVCSREDFHMKTSQTYVMNRNIIDRRQHLSYCTIQKSASTFWKRVFLIVIGQSKAGSPFDPSVVALGNFDQLTYIPKNIRRSFMNESLTFMFVRDPYSRLFSGYVDKLFSPNVFFWTRYGTFGIKQLRTNLSRTDLRCGHDLTFREFVKTVIYAEKHNIYRDGHFTPQYEHCDPCQYQYDVIGKLETLAQDTFYLLTKMRKLTLMKSIMNRFQEQYVADTIRDQVAMLFAFRPRYTMCGVTFFEAQKLMWKKFQIRGILSKNSKYPVTKRESERITVTHFTRMVYSGRGDAADQKISKRNKEEAMLEAFSSVDSQDMEILSELFRPDCELFDYECRPDKLFEIKEIIKPWYFDGSTA